MAHLHRASERVCHLGVELGKVGDDGVVQADKPVLDGEHGCSGGEALAEGVDEVRAFERVGPPGTRCDNLAVAKDHQAVRVCARSLLQGVEEGFDAAGVDRLGRRGT